MAIREIIFRGKWINNGEWLHGDYVHRPETPQRAESHFICLNGFNLLQVDPSTVGQYTGLKDRNGMRIFEGDVLKSAYTKRPYVVCFGEYTHIDDDGCVESEFGWYNIEKRGYKTAFRNPDAWGTVIGNIHDNPELLEV